MICKLTMSMYVSCSAKILSGTNSNSTGRGKNDISGWTLISSRRLKWNCTSSTARCRKNMSTKITEIWIAPRPQLLFNRNLVCENTFIISWILKPREWNTPSMPLTEDSSLAINLCSRCFARWARSPPSICCSANSISFCRHG